MPSKRVAKKRSHDEAATAVAADKENAAPAVSANVAADDTPTKRQKGSSGAPVAVPPKPVAAASASAVAPRPAAAAAASSSTSASAALPEAAKADLSFELESLAEVLRSNAATAAQSLASAFDAQCQRLPSAVLHMTMSEFVARYGTGDSASATLLAAADPTVTSRQTELDRWVAQTPGMTERKMGLTTPATRGTARKARGTARKAAAAAAASATGEPPASAARVLRSSARNKALQTPSQNASPVQTPRARTTRGRAKAADQLKTPRMGVTLEEDGTVSVTIGDSGTSMSLGLNDAAPAAAAASSSAAAKKDTVARLQAMQAAIARQLKQLA